MGKKNERTMNEHILYYADSVAITKKDIVNALEALGVRKGDTVMVHSDAGSLGKLGVFDRNLLLQSIVDALKDSVGNEGTIIMPTFSYNFYKDVPFDVDNTKSTVGILTEHFRKQHGVVRTIHPTHSVAIWGRHKEELSSVDNDTFGEASIFGKLHKANAKIIFFGVSFEKSCTFVHYIEQVHKVPYRYMKQLKNKIIINGKDQEKDFYFYYRYAFFLNSFARFEKHLIDNVFLREILLGHGKISAINCKELFEEGMKLLDKDECYLLKNDTVKFRFFNRVCCPFIKFIPWPFAFINNLVSAFLYRIRKNKMTD